jgi:hypothetical protein
VNFGLLTSRFVQPKVEFQIFDPESRENYLEIGLEIYIGPCARSALKGCMTKIDQSSPWGPLWPPKGFYSGPFSSATTQPSDMQLCANIDPTCPRDRACELWSTFLRLGTVGAELWPAYSKKLVVRISSFLRLIFRHHSPVG